ncbi:alpha/beta fold hydrolase [candidate division KSB1 bacterium]|nr:alpha/beta fold hydrolase [candidate division KSB1 bacterium]
MNVDKLVFTLTTTSGNTKIEQESRTPSKAGFGQKFRRFIQTWAGIATIIGTIVAILVAIWQFSSGSPINSPAKQPHAGANINQSTESTGMAIDHQNVLIYAGEAGQILPVKSIGDWQQRRRQILDGMQQAMGPLPSRENQVPFEIEVLEMVRIASFERRKISMAVEPGSRLHAYLFIPAGLKAGERVPGLLALHPTHPLGKGDTAGLSGRENRAYGLELAQRGYVVMVPDYPSFGDDAEYDFSADRYLSGSMKGIFNHIRCVDYLCSLAMVDSARLGAIGHSLGGHNAMFVGAFDTRLKVIVASCGWTPFHHYYEGKIDGWTSDRYMPRLREVYGLEPDRVPFDFYEVVAALAPRAFFSNSPLRDSNFDYRGVQKAIPEAAKIYRLYHAESLLQVRYPDCEHDFPPEIREEAYRFIDRILSHRPREISPEE